MQVRQSWCEHSRCPLESVFVRDEDVVDGHWDVSAESEESDTTVGSCFGGRNGSSHQNAIVVKNQWESGFAYTWHKPMLLGLGKWASTVSRARQALVGWRFSSCYTVPAASSLA